MVGLLPFVSVKHGYAHLREEAIKALMGFRDGGLFKRNAKDVECTETGNIRGVYSDDGYLKYSP